MIKNDLYLYNSLTRQKELFKPIVEDHIGMYVCGPTVYSDVHLGNVLTFVKFDVIYRYLLYLGYKVRYVRNITDVGHLLDDGEDRIAKGARIEKLEPMEIVQKYANGFQAMMRTFNTLAPSIEPRATQHIMEQIEMVQDILKSGLAYEKNGSVYFNTIKFAREKDIYGRLSGRIIDELFVDTRDLKKQDEKNNPADFAIWMKAEPEHIMRWNSPWGEGFPGWHLECSVMSTKYLGKTFDIHGGGNDLKFPHHENEIAQNHGACNCDPANYWLHTNMLLMNGKKMSKSDGNTITPEQLFTGDSPHVSKAYSPMILKFFMLQSHYRSTTDLTDEALLAAEKAYKRLMEANKALHQISAKAGAETELDKELEALINEAFNDLNDDINTPRAISRVFEIIPKINGLNDGKIAESELSESVLKKLKQFFQDFIIDILGLADEATEGDNSSYLAGLMELIIDLRQNARANKDWGTADKIRDTLDELEIQLKDGKDGTSWTIK
jgi:cysteinyl-tRNA synthetase